MTTHKVLTANSTDLSQIPDKSVNLIVTSPMYPMVAMWDNIFAGQDARIEEYLAQDTAMLAFDAMHKVLNDVWQMCDRVLTDGGFVCINIGDAVRTINGNFCMYSNHTKILEWFIAHGYTALPDIIWHKPTNAPNKFMGSGMYPAGAYVTYEHEYILIFRKGAKLVFTVEEQQRRKRSAYFWEERNAWFSDVWNIKGTQQKLKTKACTRTRNAAYPFEIPYRLVSMYSIQGDTVLDPFCGTGTTALACAATQRNSISVDCDKVMTDMTAERLLTAKEQLNSIISDRLQAHNDFMVKMPQEQQQKCYVNTYHNVAVKTKQEMHIHIDKVETVKQISDTIICMYK